MASIVAHFGEEPPISSSRGSGTIFFSGCSSRCMFCQNWQISLEHLGDILTPDEFEEQVRHLLSRHRVHNLNFVTPDHFWPHIAELCERLRRSGEAVPFLFNSSGYHRPEMVEEYARWIDIFLPDFKFASPDLAQHVMGDRRYTDLALESLRRMVDARGFLEPWDPSGERPAQRGVLVRHLVLPGHVHNSLDVLRLLRREFGRFLPISVMSQFRPTPRCHERQFLNRRVTPAEYEEVLNEVERLGFENVLIQPEPLSDEFTPDFRLDRPFAANPPSVVAPKDRGPAP
ncbi:MAG: radical SAM protein [Kiritimatiellae bacterium]|nr:radical SAM protein [Kiritimatiellia bacterium]